MAIIRPGWHRAFYYNY